MDRSEIEAGLKTGRTLCVDRRDCPELPMLLEMVNEGKVTSEFRQLDAQSSVMKFRWNHGQDIANL